MEKKNLLFVAAAMVMAGCASDDMIGDNGATQSDNQVIGFNMSTPAMTRGTALANAADAIKLGQEFIVWGEKGETDGETSTTNIVFENYRVQYADAEGSTKNSTVSNTTGWDYVGIAPYAEADASTPTKVVPSIYKDNTTKQTIKYWDFTKTYTFTAVSALKNDIDNDKVTIEKNYKNSTKATHGYTITLTNGASASNIFVSDRNVITPTKPTTGGTMAAVQMSFRQFQTKIRFGFYETVPGYNVQITDVKYDNNTSHTGNNAKFGVDGNFIENPTGTENKVTYTVTYESGDNGAKPILHTAVTGSSKSDSKEFGGYIFTDNLNLGTESSHPTYDKDADGSYSPILPNTENTTDMTFKVSYKLISVDTKEVIEVTDKQVTVPSEYCQWKPNFAYTYLFKISDSSAELYPITFDAVVEADEVSKQETITEVGEPSITTYAWDATNNKVITDQNEYKVSNEIYASVMENNANVTLSDQNAFLYTVTSTAGTGAAPIISEASVANVLAKISENPNGTWTATDATGGKLEVKKATETVTYPTSVPREDNNGSRNISALKWAPSAAGTYVVEYKDANNKKYYKIVKVVAQ